MNFYAYKTTDSRGRIEFWNGREMSPEDRARLGKVESRGPFATRDEALDAQLEWEGKPTWAQMQADYDAKHGATP